MDMDAWSGLLTGRQQLLRQAAAFTVAWEAARSSVRELAKLRPNVVGCGHGRSQACQRSDARGGQSIIEKRN
jgi:hypothetical protein